MKSLIIVGSIFIAYYFEAISAQSLLESKSNVDKWFAMKLEDVNKQCEVNTDYSVNHNTFVKYDRNFIEYFQSTENLNMDKFNYTFKYVYNSNLIEELKNVIKRIQNCLDVENRLDSKDLVEVLGKVLNIHARKVTLVDPVGATNIHSCMSRIERKMDKCSRFADKLFVDVEDRTIFELLTGYVFGNTSCEDLLPLEQCAMKAMSDCRPEIKKVMKVVYSPSEVGICENFLQETDPIAFEDIDDIDITENKNNSFQRLFRK